jgi:hypothetical protein
MPGRGPQFWPFSVQIVPDQNSRYVPGNGRFAGFSKVLYRTLVFCHKRLLYARLEIDVLSRRFDFWLSITALTSKIIVGAPIGIGENPTRGLIRWT